MPIPIAAGLSPLDPPLASIRAARLLLARWRELVNARQSFGFESTLSGRTYAAMLRPARAAVYRVHISYLALPAVQYSIRRVRERVRKGGHDVPMGDLRRRFRPSLANFLQLYLAMADPPRCTMRVCIRPGSWLHGRKEFTPFPIPTSMNASSRSSLKPAASEEAATFFALVEAALRRAARKVAAENKRLGLPLIVAPSKPRKRRAH